METKPHLSSAQMVPAKTGTPLTPQRKIMYALIARRLAVFVLGLWIMSYGIVTVVKANFGVSPWDVLHLGIVQHTGLSFGRVTQLVGVVILACACILMKRWPTFGAIANMIVVGEFINLILRLHLVPEWETIGARIGLFVAGLIISGFGTGIYIQSQLGAGPRDWLMLALHEKTGWAIRWVRTILEVAAVSIGLCLGGPFFWGTIIFSLTIGHTTEYGLRMAKKWFGKYTERREVA
ncbi:YczE/YyaS/YitT family protein [Effusibacillus lacus]|uniref:YitT family protein n=1 Tax=Effusibacillus lacus TaxID=1348429 RepID=A0A292YNI2_9BACL|nr:hypothetical protein [Effusibacillus lacus]TCS72031.1 hypothetical protein EDD64_12325 [Effusibacillus lacus]GAX90323.1 hypothetical protein EFBL_1949 [Effusibacillus lacus]